MSLRNGAVVAMTQQYAERQEAIRLAISSLNGTDPSLSSFRPSFATSVNLVLERVVSSTGMGKSQKEDKKTEDFNCSLVTASASSIALGSMARLRRKRFAATKDSEPNKKGMTRFVTGYVSRRIIHNDTELYRQPLTFLDENEEKPKMRCVRSRFPLSTRSESNASLIDIRKNNNAKTMSSSQFSTASTTTAVAFCKVEVADKLPTSCTIASSADAGFGDGPNAFPEVPRRRTSGKPVFVCNMPRVAASEGKEGPLTATAVDSAEEDMDAILSSTPTTPSFSPLAHTATKSNLSSLSSTLCSLDVASPDKIAMPTRVRFRNARRQAESCLPPRCPPPTRALPSLPTQFD